ncbi:MAG: PilN domain-containing protein [Candidatus Binatia bacterium]
MIRINLLPLKETERAIGRRQQVALVALGLAIALLIMIVPFLIQGRQIGTLDSQIEQTNREIQQFNTQVKEVRELDRLRLEVQTKLRIIQDLNRKRVGPARVLDDLSTATPESLWLIDFNEVGGGATLTGLALDNETIARFMRQLQESQYFHSVDLVETSRTAPAAGGAAQAAAPASFTRFIVKTGIDYFGQDGKPPEPPAGEKPPAGQPAAPVKQEPRA